MGMSFHRTTNALALLAALALAFVPSLGRIAGTGGAEQPVAHRVHHAASHAGAPHVQQAHALGLLHARGQAHGGSPHAGDCAYCPLLASIALAEAWMPRIAAVPAAAGTAREPSARHRRAGVLGLGARGPPAGT